MHHSFANAQDDVDIKETPDEVQLTFEHRQFTATEVQVLQELEKRRVILDRREKALELRERLVDLAEKRLSEKTSSMEILKSQLEQLLANLSDKEEGDDGQQTEDETLRYEEDALAGD